ncbi:putative kinesin [Leptomonas seymouri]|uniref:Putative kinesin n=1 Tax=Leptomonas seymouri TaxID=5684 RepID=A0A0N1PA47_LEPSE|nr:putative kinesin [Leptomonas seymouri]|eukprot:KPI82933.1 putative kinesin [Leptomonas seymouri]
MDAAPTESGNESVGRASLCATPRDPKDIPADGVGDGNISDARDFPKLKSPASLLMTSAALRANLRGSETTSSGVTNTSALSPAGSPRGMQTSLAQESVSVIVRLKGAPTLTQLNAGSGERLFSPTSLTSQRSVQLLDYSVEDGTLKTPRTGRRPAFRTSGTPSNRLHLDASLGGGGTWSQQQQGQGSLQASPLMLSEGHSRADVATSPSPPTSSTTVAMAQPNAFTAAAATPSMPVVAEVPRASPANPPGGSPTFSAAGGTLPGSPQHRRSGSGCIGCRGKVLTIYSPTSDDCRLYEFGEVFEPDVTNAALCERLLPAIMEQLNASYNVCVLCYGQTGSGKTYTMNALAPAVVDEVFRILDTDNEVVEMSYIQIYNNKAYNLLDVPRVGKLGAELSKPLQTAMMWMGNNSSNNSGSSSKTYSTTACATNTSGNAVGDASEPKILVHSASEVLARMKAAARMRVTHAHALNPRSSRSFTLLTLHVTRFLEGAPLTTTRVTLADLAGTERLKKSGATGEEQNQAIFINKSLMALRELVESSNTETEVLHFRDSLLATYLAPRMRSWHLFLLVTLSMEVNNYEEIKSSLDFATNARRRKIKKLKCRTADRLSGLSLRLYGNTVLGSSGCTRVGADVVELQAVIGALQYRINILEESLKVAQLQRSALTRLCTPFVSPGSDEDLLCRIDDFSTSGAERSEEDHLRSSVERLRQSEAQIDRLRKECQHYRQLLCEREDELRSVQTQVSPETGVELMPSADQEQAGAPSSNSLAGPCNSSNSGIAHQQDDHHCLHSSHWESGGIGEVLAEQQQPPPPHSPLSTPLLSWDAFASAATPPAATCNDKDAGASPNEDSGDAHFQLIQGLLQLRSGVLAGADSETALERLHDVALRAKEQDDDVQERLLVMTSTVGGLRAQNHELYNDLLKANRTLVAQDELQKRYQESLERERVRASAAETAADELRLQLFRAYAEQPIGEELTRLYLDEQQLTAEGLDSLSGAQLAEHREEMEKFETHQRALQDKITELVDTVEQLTRAASQKDVSLAALESIITPAQRTLFQTISRVRNGSVGTLRQLATVTTEATNEESAADCLSLLKSRVSELESLLHQERQQHRLTRCEVVEAREDARRSRQDQRQAFLQQQEEERRVALLAAENFDLQQQSERHQLHLNQILVNFQDQLLELRRHHFAEMAEQRRQLEETQRQERRQLALVHAPPGSHREGGVVEERAERKEGNDRRGSRQISTRRGTSHSPLHAGHDWMVEDTARRQAGPPSQHTDATTDEYHRSNSSTLPQPSPPPTAKARRSNAGPRDAPVGREGGRGGRARRRAEKPKGKVARTRSKRSSTSPPPALRTPSRMRAVRSGRRSS